MIGQWDACGGAAVAPCHAVPCHCQGLSPLIKQRAPRLSQLSSSGGSDITIKASVAEPVTTVPFESKQRTVRKVMRSLLTSTLQNRQ
jgi:hypothetical protein